jgi:hypothetical protein
MKSTAGSYTMAGMDGTNALTAINHTLSRRDSWCFKIIQELALLELHHQSSATQPEPTTPAAVQLTCAQLRCLGFDAGAYTMRHARKPVLPSCTAGTLAQMAVRSSTVSQVHSSSSKLLQSYNKATNMIQQDYSLPFQNCVTAVHMPPWNR